MNKKRNFYKKAMLACMILGATNAFANTEIVENKNAGKVYENQHFKGEKERLSAYYVSPKDLFIECLGYKLEVSTDKKGRKIHHYLMDKDKNNIMVVLRGKDKAFLWVDFKYKFSDVYNKSIEDTIKKKIKPELLGLNKRKVKSKKVKYYKYDDKGNKVFVKSEKVKELLMEYGNNKGWVFGFKKRASDPLKHYEAERIPLREFLKDKISKKELEKINKDETYLKVDKKLDAYIIIPEGNNQTKSTKRKLKCYILGEKLKRKALSQVNKALFQKQLNMTYEKSQSQ